jgi:hypothetical protein
MARGPSTDPDEDSEVKRELRCFRSFAGYLLVFVGTDRDSSHPSPAGHRMTIPDVVNVFYGATMFSSTRGRRLVPTQSSSQGVPDSARHVRQRKYRRRLSEDYSVEGRGRPDARRSERQRPRGEAVDAGQTVEGLSSQSALVSKNYENRSTGQKNKRVSDE